MVMKILIITHLLYYSLISVTSLSNSSPVITISTASENLTMARTKIPQNFISFEEGWPELQDAVNKLIDTLEGVQNYQFTSDEYMRLYTMVYNMCSSNPNCPESQKLYDQYKKTFEDYITCKVLPSLRERKDEDFLKELVKRWDNHKVMTRWLSRFMNYLNRYFIGIKNLPTLTVTSHLTFYTLVYGEMNDQVRSAVISMIDRERKGEQIDEALVKKVVDIYVEMAEDSTKYYEKDFEEAMLIDTADYYSNKASNWIATESYKDYMLKVEGCLESEKDRQIRYLKYRSKYKLMEVLSHELLIVNASKLEEKNKELDGDGEAA